MAAVADSAGGRRRQSHFTEFVHAAGAGRLARVGVGFAVLADRCVAAIAAGA